MIVPLGTLNLTGWKLHHALRLPVAKLVILDHCQVNLPGTNLDEPVYRCVQWVAKWVCWVCFYRWNDSEFLRGEMLWNDVVDTSLSGAGPLLTTVLCLGRPRVEMLWDSKVAENQLKPWESKRSSAVDAKDVSTSAGSVALPSKPVRIQLHHPKLWWCSNQLETTWRTQRAMGVTLVLQKDGKSIKYPGIPWLFSIQGTQLLMDISTQVFRRNSKYLLVKTSWSWWSLMLPLIVFFFLLPLFLGRWTSRVLTHGRA